MQRFYLSSQSSRLEHGFQSLPSTDKARLVKAWARVVLLHLPQPFFLERKPSAHGWEGSARSEVLSAIFPSVSDLGPLVHFSCNKSVLSPYSVPGGRDSTVAKSPPTRATFIKALSAAWYLNYTCFSHWFFEVRLIFQTKWRLPQPKPFAQRPPRPC